MPPTVYPQGPPWTGHRFQHLPAAPHRRVCSPGPPAVEASSTVRGPLWPCLHPPPSVLSAPPRLRQVPQGQHRARQGAAHTSFLWCPLFLLKRASVFGDPAPGRPSAAWPLSSPLGDLGCSIWPGWSYGHASPSSLPGSLVALLTGGAVLQGRLWWSQNMHVLLVTYVCDCACVCAL